MNYTTLVGAKTLAGSIKRTVNYAQIDETVVLEDAQTLLYSILRCREMRSLWSPTVSVGDSSKALPALFMEPIGPYITDTANLRYKHVLETALMQSRIYDGSGVLVSGTPCVWTILDETVLFDCKFDTARTLSLPYYKQPALLASSSNETNWLTVRYPHLLRQACKVSAHAFMKNWSARDAELSVLATLIERTNAESDLAYSGTDYDTET